MDLLIQATIPGIRKGMSVLGIEEDDWISLLGPATVPDHGDLAIACHSLARVLRKSPVDIAQDICNAITPNIEEIAEVTSMNGFVNIRATNFWLSERVTEVAADHRLGISETKVSRTVAIDYSSPNVAKEMHVGHLRSTVIGDALTRILAHQGHTVIRENHIGDWGTPFGMLIEHLLDLGEAEAGDELGVGDLDSFYKDARGKFDEDPDFASRSRARVVLLQGGDEDTLRLWKVLVNESTRYFNEVYRLLDVLLVDEDLMGESAYHSLLPSVVSRLSDSGLLEVSDGAEVVFPGGHLNREGEPLPLIIRKGDGGYNYATTDIACIIDRTERLHADDLLYVVGTPQSRHFEMVFEVCRMAEILGDEHRSEHVNFGSVLGSDGKVLKSRSGSAVKLVDLLEESISRASAIVDEKNPNLGEDEKKRIARAVGIGAVKFADLSNDRRLDYVFDWSNMLSFEGDTAPYLQYAHARICSIFTKVTDSAWKESPIDVKDEYELRLARCLLTYRDSFESSARDLMPNRLCNHLLSLASAFGSFYENCPVLITEDLKVRNSRLRLCDATARALRSGLSLLGIDAPERM